MENPAGGIIVILVHAAFLYLFVNFYSVPRYEIWQTGFKSEGVATHFAFKTGMQGDVYLNYRVQGQGYQGKVSGFFADFEEGRSIPLIVSQEDVSKIDWAQPLRYWFIEIIVLGIWGSVVVACATYMIPGLFAFKRQAPGVLLMSIGILGTTLVYQNQKSMEAFLEVSERVEANVSEVAQETCTRTRKRNGRSREVSYPCYRPTYTYSYGRGTYTKRAERTFKESPAMGSIQTLQVWKEDPATAKRASKLPPWGFQALMGLFGLIFAWGVWLLSSISFSPNFE